MPILCTPQKRVLFTRRQFKPCHFLGNFFVVVGPVHLQAVLLLLALVAPPKTAHGPQISSGLISCGIRPGRADINWPLFLRPASPGWSTQGGSKKVFKKPKKPSLPAAGKNSLFLYGAPFTPIHLQSYEQAGSWLCEEDLLFSTSNRLLTQKV